MATPTKAADVELRPIDEAAPVRAAAAALEAVSTDAARLDARLRRFEAILDPHRGGQYTEADEDAVLEARAEIAATRVAHARAVRQLRAADAAHRAAREAERERLRASIRQRQRAAVNRLSAALTAAAAVSHALAALEAEARSLLGEPGVGAWAWHELAPESALAPSRLSDWLKAAAGEGLLDR